MVKHGNPPYLECSTRGDPRLSAFRARIVGRGFRTIEEIYQSSKTFHTSVEGVDPVTGRMKEWRHAKGHRATNQEEVSVLYETLWREYIAENPHLIEVLTSASGLSDVFGQEGHCCQATVLWKIRNEHLFHRD